MASLTAGGLDATFIVRYKSPQLAIGLLRNVLIVCWGAKPSVELLGIVDQHFDLLVKHFSNQKMLVLVDIEGDSGMPDKATQQKQDQLLTKYTNLLAGCAVILPAGNVMVGLMISAWGFFKARVADALPVTATTSREGAFKWLAERAPDLNPEEIQQAAKSLRGKM